MENQKPDGDVLQLVISDVCTDVVFSFVAHTTRVETNGDGGCPEAQYAERISAINVATKLNESA